MESESACRLAHDYGRLRGRRSTSRQARRGLKRGIRRCGEIGTNANLRERRSAVSYERLIDRLVIEVADRAIGFRGSGVRVDHGSERHGENQKCEEHNGNRERSN
jgi:hypothetical protein